MQVVRVFSSTRKLVDQSERRIQPHMDQRAHIQQQTDLPEVQAHGERTRGHMGGHQSKGGAMGATCQSAVHHGRLLAVDISDFRRQRSV